MNCSGESIGPSSSITQSMRFRMITSFTPKRKGP